MSNRPSSSDAPGARAHLLLQVDPGMQQLAADHIAESPAITEVARTTGPYDVIAAVNLPAAGDIGPVLRLVRAAPGLCALRVCYSP